MQDSEPVKPVSKDPRLSSSLKFDKQGNSKPQSSPKRFTENPFSALSSTSGFSTPRDDSAVKILETKSGERILVQGSDSNIEITSQAPRYRQKTPDKHVQVSDSESAKLSSPQSKSYSSQKNSVILVKNSSKLNASQTHIHRQSASTALWKSSSGPSAIVVEHSEDERIPKLALVSSSQPSVQEARSHSKSNRKQAAAPAAQTEYLRLRNMVDSEMASRARQVSEAFMNAISTHMNGDTSGLEVNKVSYWNNPRIRCSG